MEHLPWPDVQPHWQTSAPINGYRARALDKKAVRHQLYVQQHNGDFRREKNTSIGENYIVVAYVYKRTAILLQAMKSRENTSMVAAFKSVYAKLKEKEQNKTIHVLDNKCSRVV